MAVITNDRDVLLQGATERLVPIEIPSHIRVPSVQVFGITISASDLFFRLDADGNPINTSVTLTALIPSFMTGTVTWSKSGTGTNPPAAGTTNTWTIYNAHQTDEANTYTASIVYKGVLYTDSVTINRIRNGLTGDRGPNGVPGTLTGYGRQFGIVTTTWSSDLANRVIYNMLTGESSTSPLATTSHLLLGDTVTLDNNAGWAQTRFWNGFNAWEVLDVVIDGNLLVNGTVSAGKLTAGSAIIGDSGNAVISLGEITHLGNITSPFHVSKNSAKEGQTLISALNDKDNSVAIWGSTANSPGGNAVAGTVHKTSADVAATRWQAIGLLGADGFDGAVAGLSFNYIPGGVFHFYSANDSSVPNPTVKHSTILASTTHAGYFAGPVELAGASSPLLVGGTTGTAGQVLTSQGPGFSPQWGTPSGSVTYTNIKTAVASANDHLSVSSMVRSTGLHRPTTGAGLELAYDAPNQTSYVQSYDRDANVRRGLNINAAGISVEVDTTFNITKTPTFPTPATSTNSTVAATTSYVVNRIANDAPSKTGTGASGTWGISITGNAGYASSAGSASSSGYASSAGSATSAGSVNGYKCYGGAATADGAGNATISFPSSFSNSSFGFSAVSTTNCIVVVTSASNSSVSVQVQNNINGSGVASAAIRWTAVGI